VLDYLVASALIFALLGGWVAVQGLARRLARRRPDLGPAKEEGGGCDHGCGACKLARLCPTSEPGGG